MLMMNMKAAAFSEQLAKNYNVNLHHAKYTHVIGYYASWVSLAITDTIKVKEQL